MADIPAGNPLIAPLRRPRGECLGDQRVRDVVERGIVQRIEPGIEALGRDQRGVRPGLDDAAVLKNEDAVGAAHQFCRNGGRIGAARSAC